MKNEVFGVGSSTLCHVLAIGNTMCTTWVLLWLSFDLLIFGVGIKIKKKKTPFAVHVQFVVVVIVVSCIKSIPKVSVMC